MTTAPLRVAVAGLGFGEKVHLEALRASPDWEPVALWHPRAERLETACRSHGLRGETAFEALLDDPGIDAIAGPYAMAAQAYFAGPLGIRTDQPPVTGATLAELAGKMGVPSDRLEATVARYNAACSGQDWQPLVLDGVATQGLYPPKSNWACPLGEAPFHAYPIISSNVFTFGGLKVDTQARVVDSDGEPIDGLYAAGEVIGLYYGHYTGATSVLKGLVFGRIAGSDAATRVAAA
jgi:hypothetical protein